MNFNNKTVLITGGTRGIGLACARRFKQHGATVFTAQRSKNDEFNYIKADFANLNCCKTVIDAVVNTSGRLDILINNAGVMLEAEVEKMTLDEWQNTINVNLTVPFLLIKYAIPYLRASRGSIINIGSIEGLASNPGHAAYCASKAGLHAMTRAVAVDNGHTGIRCNAVAPGWIDTELNSQFINSMPDPKAFKNSIGKIHPLNRTGTAKEVASVVAFLASEDAGFVTGQIYTVDGGRTAKLSLP